MCAYNMDIWWWPTFFLMLQFDNDIVIWPIYSWCFYSWFLCLLLFLMLVAMVFLVPLLRPLGFLFPIRLVLFGLHHIFKLTTHTCHHLDHFHFLANIYVWLLPMNIGPFCSSPIDIILGIIIESCSFGLSIQLAMDCHLELVPSCSQNPTQTFVSLWHTFCILAR